MKEIVKTNIVLQLHITNLDYVVTKKAQNFGDSTINNVETMNMNVDPQILCFRDIKC